MNELFLKWYILLGGILGGILLLPGILAGLNNAMYHTTGISDENLWGAFHENRPGILPSIILSGGVFSLLYGFLWSMIHAASEGATNSDSLGVGLVVGGGIGVCHLVIVSRLHDVVGGITKEERLSNWLLNGFAGGIMGGIVGSVGGLVIAPFPFALFLGVVMAVLGSVLGGVFSGVVWLLLPLEQRIQQGISARVIPLVGHKKYPILLCHHCFHYSSPGKSTYDKGIRYCESCHGRIPRTAKPGKVLLLFGNISVKRRRRQFLLSNPVFDEQSPFMEVSDVFIDTTTCERASLERFLTYVLNNPPRDGISSIRIFHKGALEHLGTPLKNALQNTFNHFQRIREK